VTHKFYLTFLPQIFILSFAMLSEFNCCVYEFCFSVMPTVPALSPFAPLTPTLALHHSGASFF
jgi:hypothetical protein